MLSPARVSKRVRYTEAQGVNAMIVVAVTLNQIIRSFLLLSEELSRHF